MTIHAGTYRRRAVGGQVIHKGGGLEDRGYIKEEDWRAGDT